MKAPITIAIDTLIAEHVAPLLKGHGFSKKGQRFSRSSGDCTQLIEFDRWKYNEGSQGKFGVTVGVFYPAVWNMVLQARPGWLVDSFDERFPPVQNCLIDYCILPSPDERGLDNLWPVDATQSISETADKLVQALSVAALPWLQANATLGATLPRLAELSAKKVWLASVYLLCAGVITSDVVVAKTALAAVLAPKPSKFFPDSEREAFKALATSAIESGR